MEFKKIKKFVKKFKLMDLFIKFKENPYYTNNIQEKKDQNKRLNNFLKTLLHQNKNRIKYNCEKHLIGCGHRDYFVYHPLNDELHRKNVFEYFERNANNQNTTTANRKRTLRDRTINIFIMKDLNISKMKKFAIGYDHGMILFEDSSIFLFGNNRYFQCGIKPIYIEIILRTLDDCTKIVQKNHTIREPTKLEFFIYKKTKIRDIFCGKNFSLILEEDNFGKFHLYSFGKNKYYALGLSKELGTESRYIPTEIKINENETILKVFTSPMSKFFYVQTITSNYLNTFIYLIGKDYGNANAEYVFKKKEELNNIDISNIYCGVKHSIVKTTNGCFYSYGCNEYNQCIVEDYQDMKSAKKTCKDNVILKNSKSKKDFRKNFMQIYFTVGKFKKIQFFNDKQIKHICLGNDYTLFSNEKNEIFGFGKGIKKFQKKLFQGIDEKEEIYDMICSGKYIFIVSRRILSEEETFIICYVYCITIEDLFVENKKFNKIYMF